MLSSSCLDRGLRGLGDCADYPSLPTPAMSFAPPAPFALPALPQSAFIRIICLIRDSDTFPRQHVRDVFRQRKVVFPLKVRNASV